MSQILYRTSTLDDCQDVYELICDLEATRFSYERFSRIYEKQNRDTHYCCLVCEKDSRIIAALNMRFEEQLHHCTRIAEIMEFIVSDSCRDQGIGQEMFELAVKTARESGCSQIELATNQVRKGAHRFYERMGMKNTHYTYTKKFEDGENAC